MSATPDRILWATNISKTYDGQTYQLRDESLSVHRGDKIAILGPNGSGKSTLLSVLAGDLQPDQGNVSLRKGVVAAHVAQSLPTDVDPSLAVNYAVLHLAAQHSSSPDIRAALRYSHASATVEKAQGTEEHLVAASALASVMEEMEARPDAWQVDSYLATVLRRLELPPTAVLSGLSGGQKRRVGIAAALVSRPQVLLLDEVTNHLSVEAIEFLEEVLSDPALTVLAISHDRIFVDNVCSTAIWELDGNLQRYAPGYATFLDSKAALLAVEEHQFGNMRKALRKELEWLRKQPKARGTKNKVRVQEALQLRNAVQEHKRRHDGRTGNMKALQAGGKRLGTTVVELDGVTIYRGDRAIVKSFSYTFERGERVGIVGGNGVGKSSLLRAISGELPVTEGHVYIGDTVAFGHFEQEGIDLSEGLSEASMSTLGARSVDEMRVIDYVTELVALYGTSGPPSLSSAPSNKTDGDGETRVNAELEQLSYSVSMPVTSQAGNSGSALSRLKPIQLLVEFGFARSKQHIPIGHLSGGERRRLQLMGLLLKNPNFLMLDEVSNDLDMNTLTLVEEYLVDYAGVLLLCSHDRFMLDRLVDHLLVVKGDGDVELVEGKFTDYLARKKEMEEESRRARVIYKMSESDNNVVDKHDKTFGQERNRKLNFKERKEHERLEKEIDICQNEYDQLSYRLTVEGGTLAYEEMKTCSERLAELEQLVEVKMERWLQLEELSH